MGLAGRVLVSPLPLWERVAPNEVRRRVRGSLEFLRMQRTPHPARTSQSSVLATLSHKGRGETSMRLRQTVRVAIQFHRDMR